MFSYAHTLAGHEAVANDDADVALVRVMNFLIFFMT